MGGDDAGNGTATGASYFTKSGIYIVPRHSDASLKPVVDLGRSGLLFDLRGARDVTIRGIVVSRGSGRRAEGNATAPLDGGCLRVTRGSENVYLEGVEFRGCTASGRGGAILVEDSVVLVRGCLFLDCSAGEGGAAHFSGTHLTFATFEDSYFGGNWAEWGGGVASSRTEGGQVTFTNCTLTNSTATYGGAFYLAAKSVLTLFDSGVDGATARARGGLLAARGRTLAVLRNSFIGGAAALEAGGGVQSEDHAVVDMAGVTLAGAKSEGEGGAIWAGGASEVLLRHVGILDAMAETSGGGVHLEGASLLTFVEGGIRNATCGGRGGGVASRGGASVALRHVEVAACAADEGGGLHVGSPNGTAALAFVVFDENEGRLGSALFASSPLAVANATFAGNRAKEAGTIYLREEEGRAIVVGGGGGGCESFFQRAINLTFPLFEGNLVEIGPQFAVFWDTKRGLDGPCSARDLRSAISPLGGEGALGLVASGPLEVAAALSEPSPPPGVAFDLLLQVRDAFGLAVHGAAGSLRLEIGASGPVTFLNRSSFAGVTDASGALAVTHVVISAAPQTVVALAIRPGSAPSLGHLGRDLEISVGPCPGPPGTSHQEVYSADAQGCLPPCHDAHVVAQAEDCSDQGTTRAVRYAWARHEGPPGGANASICEGGLALPEDTSIDCWFVSARSLAATSFFVVSAIALGLHLLVLVAVVAYRRQAVVRLGQPLLCSLLILGNVACLAHAFAAAGRPSRRRCTARWVVLSLGATATCGALACMCQRLGGILGNAGLERFRLGRQPAVLVLGAAILLDLVAHLAVVLFRPMEAAPTERTEALALVRESRCAPSSPHLLLGCALCKAAQGLACLASAAKALGVARLSREARLAGIVLAQNLAAAALTLAVTRGANTGPRLTYACVSLCVLVCTLASFALVVLPCILGALLDWAHQALAREGRAEAAAAAAGKRVEKGTTWSTTTAPSWLATTMSTVIVFFTARSGAEDLDLGEGESKAAPRHHHRGRVQIVANVHGLTR